MCFQIAELHEYPNNEENHQLIGIPFHFFREHKQFDTIQESKEYPIMRRVDKNSLKRHSFTTKNMHKLSLQLSFNKMPNSHNSSHMMH